MPNPGVTTLATVRTAAQRRADMENGSFLATAEWNANIQASQQELYDLLIQKYGNEYYVASSYSFTTDGLTGLYALPDGSSTPKAFYKLLGVDLQMSGTAGAESGIYVDLPPFTFQDRNRFSQMDAANWLGRTNLRYRLQGDKLWLTPLPAAGQSIRIWYAPRLTVAAADGDTIDGVSGWEEYIVVDAAIKAMQKEEDDVSVLMAQKAALIQRIESAAENRDAGNPATVADSRGGDYGSSNPWSWW